MSKGRISSRSLLAALLAVCGAVSLSTTAIATTHCSLVSTTGLSFGHYNPDDRRPLDATAAVAVECSELGSTDVISIELSRSRSGGFAPRAMIGSGSGTRFEYNLYLDAARTLIWGDGSSGTGVYRGRPVEGRTISVPIYGRIPPAQSVAGGRYDDVIIVTLNY